MIPPSPDRRPPRRELTPLRIAVIYLVLGALWILLSDTLLAAVVMDPAMLIRLQTLKGWFYILVTAGLLYELIRRSGREVQEERNRLRVLVDTAPAGITFHSSPDGRLLLFNRTAEAILGRPMRGDLSIADQGSFYGLRHPGGEPLKPEELPASRSLRGESCEGVRILVRHPSGRDVHCLANSAPLRDAAGRITGAVVAFQDITPIQELQQQRARHVLGISHGLRTPLTVIQGQAQLLLRGLDRAEVDGRMRHSAQAVVASAQRMSFILRDLVDLTTLENGQPLQLNREPTELRSFVLGLKERLEGVFDTRRITVDAPEGLPPVSADPDRLERVLVNLLSNAFKYSDRGTRITLALSRQDGEVVTSVTDQGAGIPPEHLSHLFEPYRRTEERRESVGLGLYIARGLVEAMGGRIWAESELGKGSTFSFTLPPEGAPAGT